MREVRSPNPNPDPDPNPKPKPKPNPNPNQVPIHRNQYRKSALQFFPSSSHCLLVTEFNDDGSEGSEEEEAAEG